MLRKPFENVLKISGILELRVSTLKIAISFYDYFLFPGFSRFVLDFSYEQSARTRERQFKNVFLRNFGHSES